MIEENGALVSFTNEPVHNKFKSAQEGRPIYEDRAHVTIQTPGDTKTQIFQPANEQHKQRFPKAWAAFERGEKEAVTGTPLEQWPQITRSHAKELAHVNVRTVEQFASLSDANLQRLGPGYPQLRGLAQKYLETAQDSAKATEYARENELLRERVSLLEQENAALKASLPEDGGDTEQTSARRKPGPKPKNEQAGE